MMKILFLDASPTMLAKNLLPIANWFHQKNQNFKALFVSLEISSYTDKNIELTSLKNIKKNDGNKFISFKSFNKGKIEKFLKTNNPDMIFIDGYRIFDQLWIGIGKSLNIPTYKLQHGFEVNSVYYKPSIILSNFQKGIRMIFALYSLSKLLNENFLEIFTQYLKYLFNGETLRNSYLDNELLHPQKSFVYSDFYKHFWNNKFGFEYDKMVIITPIDFLLIPQIKEKKRENACCYITQTLVEDGRMNRGEFIKLIYEYKKIALKVDKFIIKLHPRCNIEHYNCFRNLKNVEFTRDFPNCTSYITHYSSMAYTASFFSDLVILHELKGHPIPKIFKEVASHIVTSYEEIIKILEKSTNTKEPDFEERKKKITYYAVYEKINPYERIYQTISKDFS
ncbi:MAG: hypothetical protein HQ580_11505 [Planctomycetes bacterium]|nr:hypothetical protein [Planctomycetota bacterium]